MGMSETEAKTVSAAGEIDPWPVQPSVVATKAETRATNIPGEAEKPSILFRGSCVRNSLNAVAVRGNPSKAACSVRGTSPLKTVLLARGASPPKPTPGIGEEGARSPLVRRRYIPLPSTGLALVNLTGLTFVKPLWSYSVPGSGKRARKIGDAVGAAFGVLECAINRGDNSSYRWTPALRVPTLPVLFCVLWPEDMRNFVLHSTLGGVWEPKQCCRSPNLEESSASASRATTLLD